MVAKSLQVHGFSHTKTSFFTRVNQQKVEFVHLHVFSFEPSFRVHLGVRAAEDLFRAVSLNGPTSDYVGKDFDLRFTAVADSLPVCAAEVVRYVEVVGLPWFKEQISTETASVKNSQEPSNALTCKLLGIPNQAFRPTPAARLN
ncbi:MAG: hypothetical protein V4633_02150 [Pseudomonadota bacterium]